ncbi:S-adenosyl-L-methionine-dependent methyltransferase [Crassisporium funariophilum]|nr:S-adenosyl-L-methionine-dependent methyltransferase [Crassisporium funariophilum]
MPGRTDSPHDQRNGHNGDRAGRGSDEEDQDNGSSTDDYASVHPDPSNSLEELGADDFPTYFSERGGRLFSSSSSPYPLPVDGPEQQRSTLLHTVCNQLIGANYVGPVPEVLALEHGRQKIALDLCTGNGKWVMDMAREFPLVHFRGIDIVPIATRYPLPRVQFEVQDVNSPYRWSNETFDLVHARSISMATRDYRRVLQEVARVLRPGGLFVSCEWGRYVAFEPSLRLDPSTHAPASSRFFDALTRALASSRGIQPISPQIPMFLSNSGLFTGITSEQRHMPIGAWASDPAMRVLGERSLEIIERYTDSVKPLLIEAGWVEAEVENLLADYLQETQTTQGLIGVLYTVHARRV